MRRIPGNKQAHSRAMKTLPRFGTILLTLTLAAGAAPAQQVQPPATTYRVINLGSGPLTTLPKINAAGQVVFSINPRGPSQGYFYDGTAVRAIGTLGGAETFAMDLNKAGQVAGGSSPAQGGEHAFVWSAAAGMRDLGVLAGAANSRGEAINGLGVVTGSSDGVPLFSPRAFRWSLATGMENLGAYTPGLGSFSGGSALNDAGLITGSSDTAAGATQAFTWTRTGGLLNIDTLGSLYSSGAAVGAAGEVAGSRIPAGSGLYRAFVWTRAGGMRDIGTGGGTESFAMAMSPGAQVAGLINLADGWQRAISWTRAGGMRNLGTLGGRSSRAIQLNNKGQVVGFAYDKKQAFRAFVWSAQTGMVDLNTRLRQAPPGLVLDDALAINDSGAIVASSNAGLVLLKPVTSSMGVSSEPPVLGPITGPEQVRTGAPLHAAIGWVDQDRVGVHSVSWSWGDGSSGAGRLREDGAKGSATASHSYAAPGIYPVTLTLLDRSGRSTTVTRSVVVAPPGGTLAGAGALMSPLGASGSAPLHSGKAHFSLVAPGAASPGQLRFDLPGLSLRSDALRLVGRQGGEQVFEGSGTAGNAGTVRFRLATSAAAAGGEPGRVGLRIWKTDPVSKAEVVVYDNRRSQSAAASSRLMEGAIVQE